MLPDRPSNSCQHHGEAGQVAGWDDFSGNTRLHHSLWGRSPGKMASLHQRLSPCTTQSTARKQFLTPIKYKIKRVEWLCVVFFSLLLFLLLIYHISAQILITNSCLICNFSLVSEWISIGLWSQKRVYIRSLWVIR